MIEFVDFARIHGLDIRSLNQGDKIFRCPTVDHPTSKNGAYLFDGRRGIVWNWESGEPAQFWNSDKTTPWTEQDKAEWHRRRDASRKVRQQGYAAAARRAAGAIKAARPDVHPYLAEKGFPEEKTLVAVDGAMIVPMRIDGDVSCIQSIKLVNNDWEKKFIYGARTKGAAFVIGPNHAPEKCLVEGYSTGLSVDTALRLLRLNVSVVVCFSAQNLLHIAQTTTGRRFAYADNDQSGTGQRVADASGLPYCMSDVIGNDANDDYRQFGVMAVAKKIMEVRKR